MDDISCDLIEDGVNTSPVRIVLSEPIDIGSKVGEGIIPDVVPEKKIIFLEYAFIQVHDGHESESSSFVS